MQKNNLFVIAICTIIATITFVGCSIIPKAELSPEDKKEAQAVAATLPFNVTIGGQKAQPNSAFCAKILLPIDNKAEIEIDELGDDVVIATIIPSTKDGVVKTNKKPLVIKLNKENKATINQTFSGKKLTPGDYIMNINANDKIATIFFTIK